MLSSIIDLKSNGSFPFSVNEIIAVTDPWGAHQGRSERPLSSVKIGYELEGYF